jgi:hypothetical protein
MCARRWPYYLFDDIVGLPGVLPGAQGRVRMLKLH